MGVIGLKKAIILHGICDEQEYHDANQPSPSNNNWIAWLQKQLMIKGFDCQTPEVPYSYKGIYEDWKRTFERMEIDKETILIGHSAGCGFFLKWLSANDTSVDKIYMVAPWLDPYNEYADTGFLSGDLNDNIPDRLNGIEIIYCEDDPVKGVQETVKIIQDKYPSITNIQKSHGLGHFSSQVRGTDAFPEILEFILK